MILICLPLENLQGFMVALRVGMKNILITDDEQQTMTVFHAALSASGYKVVPAPNAMTALDLVKKTKFDLILLDEMMPDMSGNDVIQKLKEDPETKDIPIVILTNYGEGDLIKSAMEKGATDYILKYQMTPNDLSQKIKKLLGE